MTPTRGNHPVSCQLLYRPKERFLSVAVVEREAGKGVRISRRPPLPFLTGVGLDEGWPV